MEAAVRENYGNSRKKIGQGIRKIIGNFKIDEGKIKCKRICNLKKNYLENTFVLKEYLMVFWHC